MIYMIFTYVTYKTEGRDREKTYIKDLGQYKIETRDITFKNQPEGRNVHVID